MAKKKKQNQEKDAAADFFGDSDIDWMDDDEPESDAGVEDEDDGAGEALHAAPPPPPPFKPEEPSETAEPESSAEPEASASDADPPDTAKKPGDDTVVFSAVPTLPPGQHAPAAGLPSGLGEGLWSPGLGAALDAPDRNAAPPDAPDAAAADDETEPEEATPSDEAPSAATPDAAVTQFAPADDGQEWRAAASALVAEAGLADTEVQGELLFEAGYINQVHLGDLDGAVALYRDAKRVGAPSTRLLGAMADVAASEGRWPEVVAIHEERAKLFDGVPSSEAYVAAADIAATYLARREKALGLLRNATSADSEDYIAYTRLRELLPGSHDSEPESAEVLGRLAELAEGRVAASAYFAQSQMFAFTSDRDEEIAALRAALAQDRGHAPAFTRLVDRLGAAGEHKALADLLEEEAARDDQDDPGWWHLQAARASVEAEDAKRAEANYELAAEAGYTSALRELQTAFLRQGAFAEFARTLSEQINKLTNEAAKSQALYYLGWVRETRLEDAEGALAAYREATTLDPTAGPAADGVGRLLESLGRSEDLLAFWEQRLASAPKNVVGATLLRMGEVAEVAEDYERAADCYARAREATSDANLTAIQGLTRVYAHLGRYDDLMTLFEQRANAVRAPAAKAEFLRRAGAVGPVAPPDRARAVEYYLGALRKAPAHLASLEDGGMLLAQEGRWVDFASALAAAGAATSNAKQRASLYYQAARICADRTGDTAMAGDFAARCLKANADFLPAQWLARRLSSDPGAMRQLHLQQSELSSDASSRCWYRYAAGLAAAPGSAEAKADLQWVLDHQTDHSGALLAMELHHLHERNTAAVAALHTKALDEAESASDTRLSVYVAELLGELDRAEDAARILGRVLDVQGEARPLRAAARIASSIEAWDLAASLLEPLTSVDDRLERARILDVHCRQPARAVEVYDALLGESAGSIAAAAGLASAAEQSGDNADLLRAWMVIAEHGTAEAMQAAYAQWAAQAQQEAGDHVAASQSWEIVLTNRASSEVAFDGAVRALVAVSDASGVKALFEEHRPELPVAAADALERAGDSAAATAVLRSHVASGDAGLPALLRLERAMMATEEWQDLHDLLSQRLEITSDESQRAYIEAKKRWLLAEKLAHTDMAWDLYRQLHDDSPEDREVTEALARIAGVRGEVALAIQYLKELAETGATPQDSARYQRRIGDVYERAEDLANARQAYLDALDHVPDDQDSLDGLKRLATAEEDWSSLVSILQREAGLSDGPPKLELLRQIARVTQERMDDRAVAMDAWRAVVEMEPGDHEALTQLLGLAEAGEEWGVFVETGRALAALTTGEERGSLLHRIGVVSQEQLDQDDAIRYFEQAMANAPPHLEAAIRLADLYRSRADWNGTVRALAVQAEVTTDDQSRLAALVQAATVEVEHRHDREMAAVHYEKVLKIDPDHLEGMRFMAAHLFDAGRFSEARPICERLEPLVEEGLDIDDFDVRMEIANFYFYFGEILKNAGESTAALERYERALKLIPTQLAALKASAPLYVQAENWKAAEQVYRQLLQLSGGHGDRYEVATTYVDLGLVERKLGKADKANKRFNKALEFSPNHIGALKGMALILEDQQAWSSLLTVYNNIIYHAKVPEDVIDAYMTKGRILDDHMTRPDKAAQHYRRSLDFESHQPKAYLRLAELAMRRDGYGEAGELATAAMQLDEASVEPIKPLLLLCAASAHADASDLQQAERYVAQARELDASLGKSLGRGPTADLEALRLVIKQRLPA